MRTKRVIAIERHTFAPELNKIHFMEEGDIVGTLKAPGVTTTRQYRDGLKRYHGIYARVRVQYAKPEYKWLDKVSGGRVDSRLSAVRYMREVKKGLLPNEEVKITLQTWLVG